MTADEVIATVRQRGGTISAGSGVVVIDGLALDDDLRQAIRANKPELLKRLASPPPDGSADFEVLVNRALGEMGKRYIPGAIGWVSEHRLDLSAEITASEAAIGGIGTWRPYGPEQLAGLRKALVRWYRAHEAALAAFKARTGRVS
jgi:hypothetical protein